MMLLFVLLYMITTIGIGILASRWVKNSRGFPFYRMNLLTFGDFYRAMYGRKVEIVASFMLALSYLGWVAAQMVAVGIIMQVALGVQKDVGILMGFGVVSFTHFWVVCGLYLFL